MEIFYSPIGNVSADKIPYKLKSSHRIDMASQSSRFDVGKWLSLTYFIYRPKGKPTSSSCV